MKRLIAFTILAFALPTFLSAQIGWTPHLIDANFAGPRSISAVDIDSDGDMDVLAAAREADAIAWWENVGGSPPVFVRQNIDVNFDGANSVYATDLDGDNDIDVVGVAAMADEVAWWENINLVFIKHSIDTQADLPLGVYAADMDNDMDADILAVPHDDNEIVWYENLGAGTSWQKRIIDAYSHFSYNLHAEDIDTDGDLDVVVAVYADNLITWHENDGSVPPTFTEHNVTTGFHGVRKVFCADVNSDGDMDVVGSAYYGSEIAWFENNGIEVFTRRTVANFDTAQDVYAIDIDNDNHIDIVATSQTDNTVAWFENTTGSGYVWNTHIITSVLGQAHSVYAADLDGDTDVDVLATSHSAGDLYWYESDLVGIEEDESSVVSTTGMITTIFRGPLQLPSDKECKVFDIMGRVVEPSKIQPGIYFIEVDGVVTQKVVKIR